MTTEEIKQGNKLIAEFMGAKFHDEDAYGNGHIRYFAVFEVGNHPSYLIKSAGRKFETSDLIYHSSWDWLMPVVEKIERHGSIVEMSISNSGMCKIQKLTPYKMFGAEANTLIKAVWLAVIDYIETLKPDFGGELKD